MARATLRLVIGVLCAVAVVVVAAVTLAITYSVSIATVHDIGLQYASALANNARIQGEEFFLPHTRISNALADVMTFSEFDTPSTSPDAASYSAFDKWIYNLMPVMRTTEYGEGLIGYIFDDSSGFGTGFLGDLVFLRGQIAYNYPAQNKTVMRRGYNRTTMQEVSAATILQKLGPQSANEDPRFAGYFQVRPVVCSSTRGLWFSLTLVVSFGTNEGRWVLPTFKGLFKNGVCKGMIVGGTVLDSLEAMLLSVKSTPNTAAFIVDTNGNLVSATEKPFYTLTQVNSTPANLATGCSTTTASSLSYSIQYIGCRALVTKFEVYPPLAAVANEAGSAFYNSKTAQVKTFTVDGNVYFVASVPITSEFNFFNMNVLLFLPEEDIIGDIVTGRNTAIGVTAAICVIAAGAMFALVFFLLKPLDSISKRMLDTAKLRDTSRESEHSYSNLAEIQDLQKAYSNMNNAIKSFTRYVPRDVVKDLMISGQLCEINMEPRRCTMLFVDIAGFTTVCERVPPDVLSGLVSQYFDRASRIVMDHDGLIDKFIGDCIMAVWGAPFAVSNQEVKAVLTGKLLDRETLVDPLAASWDEVGEQVRIRVGISTGEVLAGNMGSAERMNYTVIGDPVNLSARLESMNKQFGTRVMISEMTAESLHGLFVLRLLLPIAVVGKEQPVLVYEVMGLINGTLPNDALDALQSNEYVRRDPDTSSNVSGSSVGTQSHVGEGHLGLRHRSSARTTVTMIRDAIAATSHTASPLTCTDIEVAFAQKHTEGVRSYIRKDFTKALSVFESILQSDYPWMDCTNPPNAPLRSCTTSKSVTLVQGLCVECSEFCPDDFNGVYRALEK